MPVHYHLGKFPPEQHLDWSRLIPLLGPTAAAVARYDGMLAAVPNPDVLLSPLTTQEAVLSSRIEGTQATMGEVLEFEAGGRAPDSAERREDIHEVLNYRSAMREARRLLDDLPLSQRVIRAAHAVLLDGVRGEGMPPGEYRRIPNWIGPPGCTIDDARFVPIASDRLPDAMSAWERYIHENTADRLVQLAILHAEFEALHPFLDGNGRLGRMLVPLFLWQHDLIRAPMFYVSAHFEARRDAYYDGLLGVSRDDDWTGWVEFFLTALREQAEDRQLVWALGSKGRHCERPARGCAQQGRGTREARLQRRGRGPHRMHTHQFRHYINTLAERGAMSGEDLAQWAARALASENAVYNHMTQSERAERARSAIAGTALAGPQDTERTFTPVARDPSDWAPSAPTHRTEWGRCTLNWAMTPCLQSRSGSLKRMASTADKSTTISGSPRFRRIRECRQPVSCRSRAARRSDSRSPGWHPLSRARPCGHACAGVRRRGRG